MPLSTPLLSRHAALGARFIEFAGWRMPLDYGSQLAEHQAVRNAAGLFDVSHMLAVDVAGNVAAFDRLFAARVSDLAAGRARYTCLLTPEGGIVDDVIIYRHGNGFRMVVNAGTAEKDLAWMAAHAPATEFRPRRDLAILSLQGPHSCTVARRAIADIELPDKRFSCRDTAGFFCARTGYTGEDGFELLVPVEHSEALWNALAAAGAAPCGLGARDSLRLEAAMLLYGQDMDEGIYPMEVGLKVDTDRDFIGKAALATASPRHQLLGLVAEGRGMIRHGQKVQTTGGHGFVTSGGYSPALAGSIALARLPLSVAVGDRVDVLARGKTLPARVAAKPFVPPGTPCS